MKTAFVKTINNLMRRNKDILTLTADMGFSVFENLQKEFPQRFINTGITEQSSTGIATGLALSGYKVFLYAQAVFITMRCFEQVRLDVAYNNTDVKLVGATAGLSLNQLGVSHFATNDIALMRTLPTMTIFTPGDPNEVVWAVKKAYKIKGPTYIRLSKKGSEKIHRQKIQLPLGKAIKIKSGRDGSLFVCGGLLSLGFKTANLLAKKGVNISLFSFPTVKPIDKKLILRQAKKTGHIFTLEEHDLIGGLASTVAEILAQTNVRVKFLPFALPPGFINITGSHDYLLQQSGFSEEKISQKIIRNIKD